MTPRHRSLSGRIIAASALVAAVLAVAFVPFVRSFDQAESADRADEDGVRARTLAAAVLGHVVDIQAGGRGFVITGNERFLEPSVLARRNLPGELRELARLVPPSAPGGASAAAIARDTSKFVDGYSTRLVDVARSDRRRAARIVASGEGKRMTDRIRAASSELAATLDAGASRRREEERRSEERALTFALTGLLASLCLIAIFAGYLRRSIAHPVKRLSRGAQALAEGDLDVRVPLDGPAEFAELAGSFNDMASALQSSRSNLETSNRELAKAREEADRANAAKNEFLSRMSHELRTPLNSVIGFAQLLELDGLEGNQAESVERILKGGRHLVELIDEVLDISRIESGSLGLSPEEVDAASAVAEAVDMIRPLASAREVRVLLRTHPGEAPYVLADQQRLKQVLLNLLSNAVKYNHRGGTVEISLEAGPERVRIAVRDTGRGLQPEELARLFTPFDRLGQAGGDVQGTGLGLVLSKRLVEAMAGELIVESEPGRGSVFTVELPAHAGGGEGGDARDQRFAGFPPPAERQAKVLYIEDNSANIRLAEQILARRPEIELLTAMQGGLGLELAEQHQPSVVILDLHLPDMHGSEVFERLRSNPATRAIPVIFLSADATKRQSERLLRAGASAYLTKPLDVREFLAAIDECLLHQPTTAA